MKTKSINTEAGKIIIVESPDNSFDHKLYNIYIDQDRYLTRMEWNNGTLSPFNSMDIGYDNYKLLGVVTAPDIVYFDCERLVEDCPLYAKMWKNYNSDNIHYPLSESCSTAKESFLSLLAKNGVHFVNPYGEGPGQMSISIKPTKAYRDLLTKEAFEWQEAEKELYKKCIILLQINSTTA